MGGMGGAQSLAETMIGACFPGIDVDPARIEKRLHTGYCDEIGYDLDDALNQVAQLAARRLAHGALRQ
jgi:urocanate hydratase